MCERFVAFWQMELIREKIDKRQFGSLKNSSTTHALLSLVHHLLRETDEPKNAARILLMDFSKAFDHIEHNILLTKLSDMDVPPIKINWMEDFLTQRNGSDCPTVCRNSKPSMVLSTSGNCFGPDPIPNGMINDLLVDWKDRWKFVEIPLLLKLLVQFITAICRI